MQAPETSKYAIAQINIPIEIFPNGEWTNHNDRVSIQIARASELPPISEIDSEQLQYTIQDILGGNETTSVKIPIKFSSESEFPFMVKTNPIEDTQSEPSHSPPPMETVEYVSSEELLARPRRQPSKNTSFKHTPYKSHNKTKHNRWTSR